MGKSKYASRNTEVERCPSEINDDETDSYVETSNVDDFGVSFIFERALRRQDVHAEQRKLQQDKFDSHLEKYEANVQKLEQKLSHKGKDFKKLQDNVRLLQKELIEIKTEEDILEMKLQQEQEISYRMNRDAENLRWTKNELIDMIIRNTDINVLRKKMKSKRLYQ